MSDEKAKEISKEMLSVLRSDDYDHPNPDSLKSLEEQAVRIKEEGLPSDSSEAEKLVQMLDAELAASHPVLERLLRDLIEVLAKMGI